MFSSISLVNQYIILTPLGPFYPRPKSPFIFKYDLATSAELKWIIYCLNFSDNLSMNSILWSPKIKQELPSTYSVVLIQKSIRQNLTTCSLVLTSDAPRFTRGTVRVPCTADTVPRAALTRVRVCVSECTRSTFLTCWGLWV